MVARGADLQVSAAVPVLLESARLRGPAVQARALDGRVVPGVPRSQGAGCAAARALRWRADPARGSGGTGGRSARAGALYVAPHIDRKSTRLNSSHPSISYAVFCLKVKMGI